MSEHTIYQQVITRAVKDQSFRERLLTDPRRVLVGEYNMTFPATTDFRVLEEKPDTLLLILPAPEGVVQELTDDELEAVAGGQAPYEPKTFSFICDD